MKWVLAINVTSRSNFVLKRLILNCIYSCTYIHDADEKKQRQKQSTFKTLASGKDTY